MMLEVALVGEVLLAVLTFEVYSLFFWKMSLFVMSEIRLCSKFLIALITKIIHNTIMDFVVPIKV